MGHEHINIYLILLILKLFYIPFFVQCNTILLYAFLCEGDIPCYNIWDTLYIIWYLGHFVCINRFSIISIARAAPVRKTDIQCSRINIIADNTELNNVYCAFLPHTLSVNECRLINKPCSEVAFSCIIFCFCHLQRCGGDPPLLPRLDHPRCHILNSVHVN